MIVRKIVTLFKFIEWSLFKIQIRKTIHSNISASVCAYNHGKSMQIGQIFIRANASLNTEGDGTLFVGNRVFINRNSIVSCRNKIEIYDNCIIGPNVCIYDHDHNIGSSGVEKGFSFGEVIIEKNCWIGAGTIILKGTHIGENSIIAAGSIVKGNIPANSLVYNKREVLLKSLLSTQNSEKTE